MVTNKDMNLVVRIADARKKWKKIKFFILKPFRKVYFLVENNFLHRRPEKDLRLRIAQGRVIIKSLKTDPFYDKYPEELKQQRIREYTEKVQRLQRALNKKKRLEGNPDKPEDTVVALKPAKMTAKPPRLGGRL